MGAFIKLIFKLASIILMIALLILTIKAVLAGNLLMALIFFLAWIGNGAFYKMVLARRD